MKRHPEFPAMNPGAKTIYVPRRDLDLWKEAGRAADHAGTSMSQYVLESVRMRLAAERAGLA